MEMPKRYDPKEAEPKWIKAWEEEGTFRFDPDSKAEIYSIDTPPPTVSGKMHIGHAFSYTHEDIIARFKRMQGFSVFYPFGTDDNGLATERLIEKIKKVKATKMDRSEFVKLCLDTLDKELRPGYIQDWKNLGMSCDWKIFYTTIDENSRRVSQRAFLDLIDKKKVYRDKRPITICPHCKTAIAQVEMHDEEKKSTMNYIKAQFDSGEFLVYGTTRPELLPGCIGMSINRSGTYVKVKKDEDVLVMSKEAFEKFNEAWKLTLVEELSGEKLHGLTVTMPVTGEKIVVEHDDEAQTDFGSGVVYWCSYGGMECIDFLARHPETKPIDIMDTSGLYTEGPYKGMDSFDARKQVLEDIEKEGMLILKEPIEHAVNVHERCGTDIEFVSAEQWFIKYMDIKKDLEKRGEELHWHPKHMKNRYDNWVKGLKWDWCISRQRYSGVPFPVWYDKKTMEPIFASEEQLPADPLKDLPKGYTRDQVIPEKDIMDTWATSSLTPQIATEGFKDHAVYEKLQQLSLRHQAHDIISFWLFNTVVRSHLHHDRLPWKDVMISGWALDPHGKKMSKSKGNVVEPKVMIDKYSADSLRYWTAGSKLGDDLPFQEKDLLTGQKFTTKIWNASKFAFMHLEDYKKVDAPKDLEIMDAWLLSKLSKLIEESTNYLEKYEYSHTKLETDKFFWQQFCDNYLEICKDRLYNPDKRGDDARASGQYTLYTGLLTILKLMAPITPFITEELYHAFFKQYEEKKSIHVSSWPTLNMHDEEAESVGDVIVYAIHQVRKAKSEQNKSMKDPVASLLVKAKCSKESFSKAEADLKATTNAEKIIFKELEENSELDYEVVVDL